MASHGKRKAYKDEVANDDGIVYVTFTIKGQVCVYFTLSLAITSIFHDK